jgi:ABC-type branched-subunit amino acid transport system substrate-binding protein
VQAQVLRLGAVLPLSGANAQSSDVLAAALEASVEALRENGVTLEFTLLDSRSDPEQAAAQAEALVASGVHALVCCTTPEEAARVTPPAVAAGLPLLTLTPVTATAADPYWLFSLAAGERAQLERLLLETSLHPFALMAPMGSSGDRAAALLQHARVGAARYPQGRTPLTPEALWVATREPGSVVVWDESGGTVTAADALAARGYRGALVVRSAIWARLGALERAKLTGAKSVLSPAVLGYTLSDAHASKKAVSRLCRALVTVPNSALSETALAAGASAWDAALLVGLAAEQLLTYGLELGETEAVRRALRDALVGLEPVTGAGGSYDFGEGGAGGLQPGSLVLAEWRSGRFRPLP